MFAVPASTCTNVRRHNDNKATSSLFHSIKIGVEKLQKTSLMKCQSQLASLQLIHKSWWQCRLPSLLNWQAPKEAHLPGITPLFRFAFPWIIWKSPRGNKFQLIYFLLRAFSTLSGLKASSNNSTYTHTHRQSPKYWHYCAIGQSPADTRQKAADRCCSINLLRTFTFGKEYRCSPSTLPQHLEPKHTQNERLFFSHTGYL